jgi:hypothetical protein
VGTEKLASFFRLLSCLPFFISGMVQALSFEARKILNVFWRFFGELMVEALMIKRWRFGFNPTTEYFSFRHLWVLLPNLPLQLWNHRALKAIGNCLGRFIGVDEDVLLSSDKRMAKILVEVDTHAGLSEVLEIEWRDLLFTQRLDYLGLPFRCSRCRRTGHLRNNCTFIQGLSEDNGTSDEEFGDTVSRMVDDYGEAETLTLSLEDNSEEKDTSFVGKLKFFCPSIFNSLSLWERELLNKDLAPVTTFGKEFVRGKSSGLVDVDPVLGGLGEKPPLEDFPVASAPVNLPFPPVQSDVLNDFPNSQGAC